MSLVLQFKIEQNLNSVGETMNLKMRLLLVAVLMIGSLAVNAEITCTIKKNDRLVEQKFKDVPPLPGTPEYAEYDVEEEPQSLYGKVDNVDVEVTYLPFQEYFFFTVTDLKTGISATSYSDVTLQNSEGRYSVDCYIEEEL